MTPRVVILGILVLLVATSRPAPETVDRILGRGDLDGKAAAAVVQGRTGAPLRIGKPLGIGSLPSLDSRGAALDAASEETRQASPAERDLATGSARLGGAPQPDPALITAPATEPYQRLSGPALIPPPLTGTPADFTSQGSIAWAAPKYGPLYLALPEPRGTVARICGPADCVTRTSTDYGPDQRIYPDRIADVSARDFPAICGVPLSFGRCPGSVTILSRPKLPETDQ